MVELSVPFMPMTQFFLLFQSESQVHHFCVIIAIISSKGLRQFSEQIIEVMHLGCDAHSEGLLLCNEKYPHVNGPKGIMCLSWFLTVSHEL